MRSTHGQPHRLRRMSDRWRMAASRFVVMAVLASRRGRLSGVPDEGAVLRAVRLRLQPAARLCRPAVLRPCDVLRLAGYVTRTRVKVWGWPPEFGILAGTCCRGGRWAWWSAARDPPPGHLFRDDHAGPGADGLFLLPAGEVHRRRGRHSGGAARHAVRPASTPNNDLTLLLRGAGDFCCSAFCSSTASIHSPFGQVLKAIRENEPRAISLGYEADRYKLLAFVLSAALAGLAGATKALVFQLASLTDVHWQMSGEVVLMTLVGGLGTVFGPVVGASIIITMQNYLAGLGEWVLVIQGVIFVVVVHAVPSRHRRRVVGVLGQATSERGLSVWRTPAERRAGSPASGWPSG